MWRKLTNITRLTVDTLRWSNLSVGWYYHKQGCYYDAWEDAQMDGLGVPPPNIFLYALEVLKMLALSSVCEFFDHKWIDHSSAGPDSGCIAMSCTRCGHDYHVQLY